MQLAPASVERIPDHQGVCRRGVSEPCNRVPTFRKRSASCSAVLKPRSNPLPVWAERVCQGLANICCSARRSAGVWLIGLHLSGRARQNRPFFPFRPETRKQTILLTSFWGEGEKRVILPRHGPMGLGEQILSAERLPANVPRRSAAPPEPPNSVDSPPRNRSSWRELSAQ